VEGASDLLAERDSSLTPFLAEQLITEPAIVSIVGSFKVAKTFVIPEITGAVVTGNPRLRSLAIPESGPVIIVLEDSGRAAPPCLYGRRRALG
jgi:hypothetical protein